MVTVLTPRYGFLPEDEKTKERICFLDILAMFFYIFCDFVFIYTPRNSLGKTL